MSPEGAHEMSLTLPVSTPHSRRKRCEDITTTCPICTFVCTRRVSSFHPASESVDARASMIIQPLNHGGATFQNRGGPSE